MAGIVVWLEMPSPSSAGRPVRDIMPIFSWFFLPLMVLLRAYIKPAIGGLSLSRYFEVVFQQCEVRLEALFLFFLVDCSFYLKGL